MIPKIQLNRKLIIYITLILFITACAPNQTSQKSTPTQESFNTPKVGITKGSTALVTSLPETVNITSTKTPAVNNNNPNNTASTESLKITTESTIAINSSTITPIRTPLPGEIINSPDESCQLVPSPELTNILDLTQQIHLAGLFYLCDGWPTAITHRTTFDLDTGWVGREEDVGTDLYFVLTSPTIDNSINYNLTSINGSHLFKTTTNTPRLDECQSAISTVEHIILNVTEGFSSCWITNEGRLAFVQVVKINPYGEDSIAISFVTWDK